jgi:hypothetical protein
VNQPPLQVAIRLFWNVQGNRAWLRRVPRSFSEGEKLVRNQKQHILPIRGSQILADLFRPTDVGISKYSRPFVVPSVSIRVDSRVQFEGAKESLREITWNGVNETVIRCSSSIKSSLAGSSKILTITAFFSGRAVSKVVWPRFP